MIWNTTPAPIPCGGLMKWVSSMRPLQINHHGAYSGALFDHSLAVTGALLDYTDKMGLTWSDARSPYIVGMFHDLCKCDNYKVVDGKWKYNPNMILPGHGEKSIIMLQNIAPML